MKSTKIFLVALLLLGTTSFAQVGLLSSNNQHEKIVQVINDSSYRFPTIIYNQLEDWYNDNPYRLTVVYGTPKDSYFDRYERNRTDSLRRTGEARNLLIANYTDSLTALRNQKEVNDSVLAIVIKDNNLNTRNNFNAKLSLFRNQNKALGNAILKSNFLTRHYPVDSLQMIVEFQKFTRDMSAIYADLVDLEKANDLRNSLIERTAERMNSISTLDSINFRKENLPRLKHNLLREWEKIASDTTMIAKSFREDTLLYHTTSVGYEAKLKNYISLKKKEEVKTSDFGAFPRLTSILGKREIIPQLQLYGSYKTENATKSFEGNIDLSVGPNNTPDTANLYSIFIQRASKFLVHTSFVWSFMPVGKSDKDSLAKKLGICLDVSFATKNFIFDTTKNTRIISSSVLYTKAGLEFGIIPKRLSVYGNINTATMLDKIDEFKAGTGIDSKFFGFIDCGAKLYLDPTPHSQVANDLFIYCNLNFIINGGDVKRVTKSNDLVIPSIQIGILKSLGKF